MNITVTGRHIEVSASTKSYTEEKFGKISRFFHDVTTADVIFKQEDRSIHCEAILHIRNHENVVIDVAKDTLHEAVDVAIDKCERQLRRLKEKKHGRRRKHSQPALVEDLPEDDA